MEIASSIAVNIHQGALVRTATPTAAIVDLAAGPYNEATFLLITGPGGITFTGTNKLEWVLTHSNNGTDFDAVTADDLRSSTGGAVTVAAGGVVEAYTSAKSATSCGQYAYVGRRRYLRAQPTYGGTHATGTVTGAYVLLSGALRGPVD